MNEHQRNSLKKKDDKDLLIDALDMLSSISNSLAQLNRTIQNSAKIISDTLKEVNKK